MCDDSNYITLSRTEIYKSIPSDSTHIPDKNLSGKFTEWRWRIFDIEGKIFTEISRNDPNKDRIFLDKTGNWIKYDMDDSYNKYIIESYYYYGNN